MINFKLKLRTEKTVLFNDSSYAWNNSTVIPWKKYDGLNSKTHPTYWYKCSWILIYFPKVKHLSNVDIN